MNKLLIHADPGARSGFIAAWLENNLTTAGFDVAATTKLSFLKFHYLDNSDVIKKFQGIKIRIHSEFYLLNLHLLLFLRKNVHLDIPNFTKDEFSLETFSKVYVFAKECFDYDKKIDYSLYDYKINFADTYNIQKLIDLYYQINQQKPSDNHIDLAIQLNKMNQIELDTNHACNIAAMILETESNMNLLESDRLWSIVDVYQTTPIEKRYQKIKSLIVAKNYVNSRSNIS